MIWRDDDVPRGRRIRTLLITDDVLQRFGQTHTVAIIAADLTSKVAAAIRERSMVAQLHCWAHDDLTETPAARERLGDAVEKIADLTGQRPTVLYPPWNRTNEAVELAAAALGLRVCAEKLSLDQYIRFKGDVREDVVNFHHWSREDRKALRRAMRFVHLVHA
jgi:peptidoglycan/xylan/chitin deacetylase (PgdA/CDA1 family)